MRKYIPAVLITLILFLTPNVSAGDPKLGVINEKVCWRFQEDVNKLAAIMDEVRARKGIKETRVAYGYVDTPIESADYWVNYAAEALAYQKAQQYTSSSELKNSLEVLRQKILKAKMQVSNVI